VRDAVIHRVSRDAGEVVCSICEPVDRHGLRPRDDNALFAADESAVVLHDPVIARNNVTRQSIVSRGTRTEDVSHLRPEQKATIALENGGFSCSLDS